MGNVICLVLLHTTAYKIIIYFVVHPSRPLPGEFVAPPTPLFLLKIINPAACFCFAPGDNYLAFNAFHLPPYSLRYAFSVASAVNHLISGCFPTVFPSSDGKQTENSWETDGEQPRAHWSQSEATHSHPQGLEKKKPGALHRRTPGCLSEIYLMRREGRIIRLSALSQSLLSG